MTSDTTHLTILILAVFGIAIVVYRLWSGRRHKQKLERDTSGLWRYHKDTQFQRKLAYGGSLHKDSAKTEQHPIAVINFAGDIRARQHKSFAKLVDEIVINKDELSEVVVVVNSPGGMVAQYGHAYAQMERLRGLGIPVTVCIDVVAASGGYLMSLPATKILAAPFAIVGSVGVLAFVPNIRRFLANFNIDPRTFSAGKYKSTVSMTDQATPQEIEHFQTQLETIHQMFVGAVQKYRTDAKIDLIQTGDHWSARESIDLELGLVDEIQTSQDYLLQRNESSDLVVLLQKRSFWDDGFGRFAASLFDQLEERLYTSGSSLVGMKGV